MSDLSSQVQPAPAPFEPQPSPAALPPAPPSAPPRPRVWPALVVVALEWIAIETPRWLDLQAVMQFMAMFLAPIAAGVLMVAWWLFFSRIRWRDRWLGLGVCAACGVAAGFLAPYPAMAFLMFTLPWVTTVWACWMLGTFFLPWPIRRAGLLAAFVLTWGFFPLLRFEGVDGNMHASFAWRWSPQAEDKLMVELAARGPQKATATGALTLQPGDWPGFRGPERDGRRAGVRIATDWTQHPPQRVWRHRIGPGWGSFAVVGDRLVTQEQRLQDEMVVCYNVDNGEEIWAHKDAARFEEDVAKAGPRATPTFYDGRIYALGARGLLNCLDAATGEVVWRHDVAAESGAELPHWGFSASPLVMNGVVTVFVGGPGGKSVMAYDASSGNLAWHGGDGRLGYSSTQPAHLGGVDEVLAATDVGLTAFDPAHGDVLWQYGWPLPGVGRIIQPAVLDDSDVLLGGQSGTRRVHVRRDGGAWTTEEAWTSAALQPFYYDQVVYQGHLYGFDGPTLICASLEDGGVKWRKRNDTGGQILLLPDQGLLLILWEKGAVSLVQATPEGYKELGRFQAIDDDHTTWNHPVVAHGKLFVRNGEWAACYRLTEQQP